MEAKKYYKPNTFSDMQGIMSSFIRELGTSKYISETFQTDTAQIITIIFEKHFLRTNSFASASLTFVLEADKTQVSVVISGAGAGFLNISYRSGDKFLRLVDKVLTTYDFQEMQ